MDTTTTKPSREVSTALDGLAEEIHETMTALARVVERIDARVTALEEARA